MKKKVLALLLIVALVASLCVAFTACNKNEEEVKFEAMPIEEVKFGLICLHDTNSTYDKNFIDAFVSAMKDLGMSESQYVIKTNIEEGDGCLTAAEDLVDQGCNIIFADSFGHEEYMIEAAKEFPSVRFCHATGNSAHTAGLKNFSDAFASIYEGRFLAGVAAGMKLNAMISDGDITADQAKMGYVGAFPYAEVKSGYTSFYLGAKYVCPTVTMEVKFTNSWYDETKENESANALIKDGCVLISQHADSYGAPNACESAKVPNVSYNGSTESVAPETFIISSRINWAPYFKYAVNCVVNGEEIATDWVGTMETSSVELSALGAKAAAAGTSEKIAEIKAKLLNDEMEVFDVSTFTVGGKNISECMADVDYDDNFTPDTQVIKTNSKGIKYFAESEFRSAPYFELAIDGITIK